MSIALAIAFTIQQECTVELKPESVLQEERYAWVRSVDDSSLRAAIEHIIRHPEAQHPDIPGQTGPQDRIEVDLFHADRGQAYEQRRGGEIIMRTLAEPRSLDGNFSTDAGATDVYQYIEEALLTIDSQTWEQRPSLAERFVVEDLVILPDGSKFRGRLEGADGEEIVLRSGEGEGEVHRWPRSQTQEVRPGCSFTFWLRSNVRFHNGMPFTAHDVAWWYKAMKTDALPFPHLQAYYHELESWEVLDEHTIRATASKPYWRSLDFYGGEPYMTPHEVWDPDNLIESDPNRLADQIRDNPVTRRPIGTGPYKLKEWREGYEIVLERYEEYQPPAWMTDPIQFVDRIRFRPVPEDATALIQLRAREVDFVYRVPSVDQFIEFKRETEESGRFCYVQVLGAAYYFLAWNLQRPAFQDRKVRWALALGSLDIDRFITDVLREKGIRATQHQFQYGRAGHPGLPPVPYEPQLAQQLLAEAGWWDSDADGWLDKDGQPLRFTLLVRNVPNTHPFMQMAVIVKENYRRLGIDMEIRNLDWASLQDQVDHKQFDAVNIGWAHGNPPNESDLMQIFHSDSMAEGGSNYISYSNPELDRLIEESRVAVRVEERLPIQNRLSEILYLDQVYMMLWTPCENRIYNRNFRNVKFFLLRPGYDLSEWVRLP